MGKHVSSSPRQEEGKILQWYNGRIAKSVIRAERMVGT